MHATRSTSSLSSSSQTPSIGERLAAARRQRGISYEDAAAATKLSVSYLQAMEANRFDQMPAPIYAKNFIRIYGTYLGLDGRQLAEEFSRMVPLHVELPPKTQTSPAYHVSVLITQLVRHRLLVGAVLLAAISLILYLGSSLERRTGSISYPTDDPQIAAALRDYQPMFDTTEPLPSLE
ncbi:MAG: helix-turn-helix domain-containing protein [bacterium]|nr:helix-turn-helix domain-containing protein [bacterium]